MSEDSLFESWRSANIRQVAVSAEILELLALAFEGGRLSEREACAKVCEVHGSMAKHSVWMAEECAALIRERGNNDKT